MTRMKVLMTSCVAIVASGGLLFAQAEVFSTLGSNETQARGQIFQAFSTEMVRHGGEAGVFKEAGADAQVAIVKSVIAFTRIYSGTADFAERYATFREGQKPSESAMMLAPSMAEAVKALVANVVEWEKALKQTPAMRKQMEPGLAQMKTQLAEMRAAADPLGAWEKKLPADPKQLIALRLRAFLDASATVDFAARTEPNKAGAKIFVTKAYEDKNAAWKMMYRAGKPAVDAARAVAQEWLKEIGG